MGLLWQKNKKFLFWVTIITIIVTNIFYVFGFFLYPNATFVGSSFLSESDVHVYYSYIEQVRQGYYVFIDLFSSEPQNRIFFNWFWVIPGLLARWFDLSPSVAMHLIRLGLILCTPTLFFYYIAYFVKETKHQRIILLLLLYSAGLGGYLSYVYYQAWGQDRLTANYPMDLWVPEVNPFLSMLYHSPHILASTLFLIGIIIVLHKAIIEKNIRYSLISGGLGLLFFQFHPYYFPYIHVLFGLILLHVSWQYKKIPIQELKRYGIFTAISAPGFLYHYWLLQHDTFTALKSASNITLTPRVDVVLVSYGFIGVVAILCLFKYTQKYNKYVELHNYQLILIWFWAVLLLLYFPLNIQRRFVQGFWFVLVLMAYPVLYTVWKKYITQNDRFLTIIFTGTLWLILGTSSILYTYISQVSNYYNSPELYYVTADQERVLRWLDTHGNADTVVLGGIVNSRLIPAYTGLTVYMGHWSETVFGAEKSLNYKMFVLGKQKENWLQETGITHVWWSDYENRMHGFDVSILENLELVIPLEFGGFYAVK